jgi:hypothetical protein
VRRFLGGAPAFASWRRGFLPTCNTLTEGVHAAFLPSLDFAGDTCTSALLTTSLTTNTAGHFLLGWGVFLGKSSLNDSGWT